MNGFIDSYFNDDTLYSNTNGECPIGDEPLDPVRIAPNPDSPVFTSRIGEGERYSLELPPLPPFDETTAQEDFSILRDKPNDLAVPSHYDELPTETELSTNNDLSMLPEHEREGMQSEMWIPSELLVMQQQPELAQQQSMVAPQPDLAYQRPELIQQQPMAAPQPDLAYQRPELIQQQPVAAPQPDLAYQQPMVTPQPVSMQPQPMQQPDPMQQSLLLNQQPLFMKQEQEIPVEKVEIEKYACSQVLNALYEPSIRPYTEAIIKNRDAIVGILNSPKQRTYWGEYFRLLRNLRRAICHVKGDGNKGPYSTARIAKVLLSNVLSGCRNPDQAFRRLQDRFNRKDASN